MTVRADSVDEREKEEGRSAPRNHVREVAPVWAFHQEGHLGG